jgi:vitamin B12 transporter
MMSRIRSVFGTLVMLAVAPAISAGQRPQSLDDLQVTATRTEVPAGAVPAAVTVISGDQLRREGIGFLLEALDRGPAVSTSQTGGYGAVASLFLRGGESDYTKLLVDGVPMNQPGGLLNLANLRLDDVDRIEIVAGPVSVLHGADAVSGVIQVFTRGHESGSRVEVAGSGGSHGNRDLSARAAVSLGGFGASLAGSSFSSSGLYPFNSDYRNHSGSARLAWQGRHSRLSLTTRLSDVDAHFPTNSSGEVVDRNQHTLDRSFTLGGRAASDLGKTTIVAEGWHHRLDTDHRDPMDSPSDTTGFAYSSTRDGELVRSGGQLGADIRLRRTTTLSIRAGVEHESEVQRSVTLSNFGFGLDQSIGDFEASRTSRQANVQLITEVLPEVLLQAGARYDDSDAFGDFTTWRLGVSATPARRWRVWAASGTAFKAPVFSELFANSAFEVGNRGLKPEQSTAVEAGLDFHGGNIAVNVTAYRQNFRDLIQYVAAEPGEPTYLNLGAARAQGVDLGVALTPFDWLVVRGKWSLLGTVVTDSGAASTAVFGQGESLLRRPDNAVSAAVELNRFGGRATLGYTWVGDRVDADFRDFPASRVTLPSYGVLTATLWAPIRAAAPGRPGLELQFRGENLLDTDWEQALGFPGRGRTLTIGGRLTY